MDFFTIIQNTENQEQYIFIQEQRRSSKVLSSKHTFLSSLCSALRRTVPPKRPYAQFKFVAF